MGVRPVRCFHGYTPGGVKCGMKSTRSRSSRTSSRLRRLTAHLPILLLVVGELFVSQPAESAYAVGSPESLAEQTHEDECDAAHAKFDSDLADFQEQWR